MRWNTVSEEVVTANEWFSLNRADVELPDGRHLDHYLLRMPPVAVAAILNDNDDVLLLWRHRFISDSWGWELPCGKVEDGEDFGAAAAREALEETGWQASDLQHLMTLEVSAGFSDARHHVYWANRAEYVGPPVDSHESVSVNWVPLATVPDLIAKGDIKAAHTIASLLTLLQIRTCNARPQGARP
jgi:8-oxo-dGTP pyrophosphatase MutT (NUDIX family)